MSRGFPYFLMMVINYYKATNFIVDSNCLLQTDYARYIVQGQLRVPSGFYNRKFNKF